MSEEQAGQAGQEGVSNTSLLGNVTPSDPIQESTPSQESSQSVPSVMVNPDGTLADGWYKAIDNGAYENNGTLSNFKTLEGLAKTLVNQQSLMGKEKVVIPDSSSSQEVWDAYYQAGGRPESVDKYQIESIDMNDYVGYDTESEKAILEFAHSQGLNNAQAKAMVDRERQGYIDREASYSQQSVDSMKQAEQSLKDEWGADFQENLQMAKNAMNLSGISEMINEMGLGNNPAMIKTLHKMGQSMREDVMGGTTASAVNLSNKAEMEKINLRKMQLVSGDIGDPVVKAELSQLSARELALRNSMGGDRTSEGYTSRVNASK